MAAAAATRKKRAGESRIHPGWWTLGLILVLVGLVVLDGVLFTGSYRSSIPVTVMSDRAGLVMDPGNDVKLRGVVVGRVDGISTGKPPAGLRLGSNSDQVRYIPANVEAEIKATTAFGNKFVDLIVPDDPSAKRLSGGEVVKARNVATEVNTVFENLVGVLRQVDTAKLNAVLSALAEGLRGQGERMGEAITAGNEVLMQLNPRSETIRQDWQSL